MGAAKNIENPSNPLTENQQVLLAMLMENTGAHFLDSGGAYGRAWQRNQGKDLLGEPDANVTFHSDYIEMELSLIHFLDKHLEFDKELNDIFVKFCKENRDKYDTELREEFPQYLSEQVDEDGDSYGESGGLYGEGGPISEYTYNRDNMLSQDILYTYFTNERFGTCVILQIHGGADARGGFTDPVIFRCGEIDYTGIFDSSRGTVFCTGKDHHPEALEMMKAQKSGKAQLSLQGIPGPDNDIDFDGEDHNWYTDDANHFYRNGGGGLGAGKQLEEYEFKNLAKTDGLWEEGKLCILDGVGFCPCCGGKLDASSY